MIAIICGAGEYPFSIAQRCKQLNEGFVLIFLKGIADEKLSWPDVESISVCIGEVGKALNFCSEHSVDSIIMAGSVTRPNFSNMTLDSEGKKWLIKLGIKIFLGDDGLLRAISDLFEGYGIKVISGDKFLNKNCMLSTKIQPSCVDMIDIQKGISILKALGNHDVGQAVIVENGLVLGIEGVEGTDQLIMRTRDLKKIPKGGVLIKMSKSAQDLRMDMPTIGLKTLENVYIAGFNGIAIEKGKCVVLNRDDIVNFANRHGLFVTEI